jgi:hypothetical protein
MTAIKRRLRAWWTHPDRIDQRRNVGNAAHGASLGVVGSLIGFLLSGNPIALLLGGAASGLLATLWRSPGERAADRKIDQLERKMDAPPTYEQVRQIELTRNRMRRIGGLPRE